MKNDIGIHGDPITLISGDPDICDKEINSKYPGQGNIAPLCPVFGECGGCSYQDIPYEEELERKGALVKDLLQKDLRIAQDIFEPIVASPKPYYYRNRLDLQFVRTRDERVLIGFAPGSGRGIVPVESCAIAERSISSFIPELREELSRKISKDYRRANLVIRTGENAKVLWGGIGKRSCRLNPEDYFWTVIDGKKIFYSLETFFQANLSILPKLFERIAAFDCWQKKPVLYDLYAGVGLFSLGLTGETRKAILIEENLPSIKLAEHNIDHNRLTHIEVLAGRMEKVLPPLLARESAMIPKVAIVDPPRAGLSPQALETLVHAKGFAHLFYLSCNPQSLARDLNGFIEHGWNIQKIVPFDFFPKTRHVETLVWLTP